MGKFDTVCYIWQLFVLLVSVEYIVGTKEQEAERWLKKYSKEACDVNQKYTEVYWQYETDISPATEQATLDQKLVTQKWHRKKSKEARLFDRNEFKGFDTKRQLKDISDLGSAALSDEELEKFNKISIEMSSTYSSASVCSFNSLNECDLKLDPDLTVIMSKSRNYDELLWVWQQWRDQSGKKIRKQFEKYVDYSNKVAELNGFSDMGEYWLDDYERESFEDEVEDLYEELKPFYEQLHAYVRKKLRDLYGTKVSREGPIPAHLLGNMWAQSWIHLGDILIPFPNKTKVDVTPQLKNKGFTAEQIVRTAEEFFTSLGVEAMPQSFWDKSVFERISGREMVCHASAWDFCNDKDVRIKMCTKINMDDLVTVHHEMGHIVYFLLYADQPVSYREGANPGFHEAVGDVIALSVSTPKHLHKIGLLENLEDSPETDLNFLMQIALDKIAFLPFGYLIDSYRWKVFGGEIEKEDFNCEWWKLRQKYQGIVPPIMRNEGDFDPGAKFHVAASVPYIRYFVATVLQFQFHKSLCMKAGQYDPTDPNKPLYKCDIYQSKEAGKLLIDTLKLGSSLPWWKALKFMTGSEKMSASSIREYFKPLEDWLEKENKKTNEKIGWETVDSMCSSEGYLESSGATIKMPLLQILVFILTVFHKYV